MVPPHSHSHILHLPGDRTLGYLTCGDPDGFPLFYFHGFPGSRYEGLLFHNQVKHMGYRLISVDRPGIGLSSQSKVRTLKMWAEDIYYLFKSLNLTQCSLMGASGGVPYVLACATSFPAGTISQILLISGMGPPHLHEQSLFFPIRLGLKLVKMYPKLTEYVFKYGVHPFFKTHERNQFSCRLYETSMASPDRECITDPMLRGIYYLNNYHAFIHTTIGIVQDLWIFANDWGIDLRQIPKGIEISIFHGKKDHVIPWHMAESLAKLFPTSHLTLYEKDGHFSAAFNHVTTHLHKKSN